MSTATVASSGIFLLKGLVGVSACYPQRHVGLDVVPSMSLNSLLLVDELAVEPLQLAVGLGVVYPAEVVPYTEADKLLLEL